MARSPALLIQSDQSTAAFSSWSPSRPAETFARRAGSLWEAVSVVKPEGDSHGQPGGAATFASGTRRARPVAAALPAGTRHQRGDLHAAAGRGLRHPEHAGS